MNMKPKIGEVTGTAGDDNGTDVVVVHVVIANDSGGRARVLADEGIIGADAAWEVVRLYLDAHRKELGLDGVTHWNSFGIQFSGGPGNVRGRSELALVLAVVSAWIRRPVPPALAVIGGLTLTGDVTVPQEMPSLVMAALSRGRRTIIVPQFGVVDELRDTFLHRYPDFKVMAISNARDVLWQVFGS